MDECFSPFPTLENVKAKEFIKSCFNLYLQTQITPPPNVHIPHYWQFRI